MLLIPPPGPGEGADVAVPWAVVVDEGEQLVGHRDRSRVPAPPAGDRPAFVGQPAGVAASTADKTVVTHPDCWQPGPPRAEQPLDDRTRARHAAVHALDQGVGLLDAPVGSAGP
jgi:hypothetical protein